MFQKTKNINTIVKPKDPSPHSNISEPKYTNYGNLNVK